MTKHDYKQNAYYLIYLVRCVLHDKTPAKEKLDKMDISQLFEVAQDHSLTAIAAYALESAGIYDEQFTQAKAKAIRKNAMLDIERERIFAEFERSGIWYMPLKGIILNDYYPRNGMRQMSDNDILFDSKYAKHMRIFMEGLGYETISYGSHQDDIYQKNPIYKFELHRSLVGSIFEDFYRYYQRIKDRLIKDSNNQYGYHFNKEDFYIFILCHAYGHYKLGGTGLRTLTDVYLFNRQENDIDRRYIHNELKKLRLIDFEKMCRELAFKIFDPIQKAKPVHFNEDERIFLDFIIYSGTYGSLENQISNDLDELSKGSIIIKKAEYKYYIRRLFPELSWYKYHAPYIYKHKILIPAYAIYRIIKSIIKINRIKNEVRMVEKISSIRKNEVS